MNLKKIKIISFFIVLGLTFLFHFLYEWLPNPIFSILFPVNESVWEHMKLLYSGFIIWGIGEYLILNKLKIKYYNYFYNLFLICITSIIAYLILFIPLYHLFGESMFINISILVIVIALEEVFSYYLLNKNNKNTLNKVSIILLLLGYFVFGILTYNPVHNYLFYDTHKHVYGINSK